MISRLGASKGEAMEKRHMGLRGLEVPAICLGTMTFG